MRRSSRASSIQPRSVSHSVSRASWEISTVGPRVTGSRSKLNRRWRPNESSTRSTRPRSPSSSTSTTRARRRVTVPVPSSSRLTSRRNKCRAASVVSAPSPASSESARRASVRDTPPPARQLSREEIADAELDPTHRLKLSEPKVEVPEVKTKRGPRYTPVSRRQDRPNAILWLLKEPSGAGRLADHAAGRPDQADHPRHPRAATGLELFTETLQAQDPLTLGLCSQIDLDAEVKKAAAQTRARAQGSRDCRAAQGRHAASRRGDHCTAPAARARTADGHRACARGARRLAAPDEEEDTPDVDSVFGS